MSTDRFVAKTDNNSIEKAHFTWKAPSNIALVKYWGKYGEQLPKNPSISFTLSTCFTETTLEVVKSKTKQQETTITNFEIYFEGKKQEDFKPKIASFFEKIKAYSPFITAYDFVIHTKNSFPHSSGIASSASGMSALALCVMSLEKMLNPTISEAYFIKKASFLARLGSGSACRSIEGPVVAWGKSDAIKDSSDLYGVLFPKKLHKNFENYQDTILLVDKGQKQISSSVGHNLMHQHPFAEKRFEQANKNILEITKILKTGDISAFIHLVESEALTLHAMMLTSTPYFILMKPNTLEIIQKIWEYRAITNSKICFTLDAGANIHVLYPVNEKETVMAFIQKELAMYCENNQYICDTIGLGSQQIFN